MQEHQHDFCPGIRAGMLQGFFPSFDGYRKNLRNRQISAYCMIGPLGHRLRRGDDWALRFLRNHTLGIKDTILEGLAKF